MSVMLQAEAPVQFQTNPCGICGDKLASGQVSLWVFRLFSCQC